MPAALIIAHPGHELRVFHWLETVKPTVAILTSGGGALNQPRIEASFALLAQTSSHNSPLCGTFSDKDIYAAILNRKLDIFIYIFEKIVATLLEKDIDVVVGDALEGYNPSHDLCRYLIGSAVEYVTRKAGRAIGNYDFPLAGRPDICPGHLLASSIYLELDAAALERKMLAAAGYVELRGEVQEAINSFGVDVFRREYLRPVPNNAGLFDPPEVPPFYETYGERKVREGVYRDVIRYREHLRPLAQYLWQHATTSR